jgi:hypothetical protein
VVVPLEDNNGGDGYDGEGDDEQEEGPPDYEDEGDDEIRVCSDVRSISMDMDIFPFIEVV